jgi:predicted O-methyltransferase YrrM
VLSFLGRRRGIRRILTWSAGGSLAQLAEQWPEAEILCLESEAGYALDWRQRLAHLPRVTILHLPQGVPFGGSRDYACHPLRVALAAGADPAAWDLVFIDGRARCDCLVVAFLVVKRDGIVVLHDAERENYAPGIALFPFVHRVEALGVAVMSKAPLDLGGLAEQVAGAGS